MQTRFDPIDNTVAEAFAAYAEAHSQGCPVVHSEAHGGFWMVLGMAEARAVLEDHERFCSAPGVLFPDPGIPKNIPLEFDPPQHAPLRAFFTEVLAPSKVRASATRIERHIDELIDGFIECGRADLHSQYAGPLTLQTIAEHIGITDEKLPEMQRISYQLLDSLDRPDADVAKAQQEFAEFALELIEERRRNPVDDALTLLAHHRVDGQPLDARQAVGYFSGFLIAGHDTTRASLCRLLYLVGRDEALRKRLTADPALVIRTVEESLRLRPPFHFFRRTVTAPTELGDAKLRPGDPVLVSFAGANRDPRNFADPERFVLDRGDRRHLTFGHGIHLCSGAGLARTQLRLALIAVLKRLPDYRSTIEDAPRETQLRIVDSMDTLPVEFTPGPRIAAA